MSANTFLLEAAYLAAALILFLLGKVFFDVTHRRFSLEEELIERDNLAMAIAVGGYFLGLTLAVGGTLKGASVSLTTDLINIFLYGIVAILLLNLSVRVNDWLILHRFSGETEIVRDKNCGVGMIEAANHVAMGLIIYGIISGEGGGIPAVMVFWILGQLTLILAARLYGWMSPYDVHDALEKDNTAVGVAFAGMLVAIGNVVRFAEQGNFVSWTESLTAYVVVVLSGLVALPLARLATDRLILAGGRLTHELVRQERPNIGAGVIEAVVYVSMSFLIGWCIE